MLEWNFPKVEGPADAEYGALLVELPNKTLGSPARFYEYGCVVSNKRISYMDLKDVMAVARDSERHVTLKQAVRDSAKLFLYREKGSTINLQSFQYSLHNQVITAIQSGLGY